MQIIDVVKYIIYFLLLTICAITDYKKGKIYNKYLVEFAVVFVLLYFVKYLMILFIDKTNFDVVNQELIDKLLGLLIGFAIGFIFYLLGIFKGGDAKLLAIVGLNVGKGQLWSHFFIIMIVAGIVALYILIKNKILYKRLKRVYLYLKTLILTRHYEKYESDDNKIKFPFAVYILIGEIISYLFYCNL